MRGALIVNGQIIIPQAENFDPAKYRISGWFFISEKYFTNEIKSGYNYIFH
jgi:hypothetical protein